MNQFELNQIRSKLRRLDLDDQFIERYIDKLIRNKEPFVTASKAIDRWEKQDSGQFVLQEHPIKAALHSAHQCAFLLQAEGAPKGQEQHSQR